MDEACPFSYSTINIGNSKTMGIMLLEWRNLNKTCPLWNDYHCQNHGLFDLLIAFMTMWHVQETCEAEMRRNATSIRTTIAVETNWFRKPNAIDLSLGDGLYHPFLVILGLVCDIGFTTLNGQGQVLSGALGLAAALCTNRQGLVALPLGHYWPHQAECQTRIWCTA